MPVTPRDASRLMVLPPGGEPLHRFFTDLPALLEPGDLLVFNDTRVIPARLVGRKESGGKVELLLCEPLQGGLGRAWRAMGQASKPIRPGAVLLFDGLSARVDAVAGGRVLRRHARSRGQPSWRRPWRGRARCRSRRTSGAPATPEDAERYQTIWARAPGSAAAPTAGLHFSERMVEDLGRRGVARTAVTLHVGPGTFLPVRGEDLEGHRMHGERYRVPPEAAAAWAECRARGGGWSRWAPPRSGPWRAPSAAARCGPARGGPSSSSGPGIPSAPSTPWSPTSTSPAPRSWCWSARWPGAERVLWRPTGRPSRQEVSILQLRRRHAPPATLDAQVTGRARRTFPPRTAGLR